ncbi:hypothetical protein ACPXB3_00385 [Gordonia sp. DT219]|uniref:hypothetical protein n=1 Tax=Gordonia sp. DT219 TaxID=3416658 RepID=UPI003CF3C871
MNRAQIAMTASSVLVTIGLVGMIVGGRVMDAVAVAAVWLAMFALYRRRTRPAL